LQGETVVQQRLEVDGKVWLMTCVSMGNPHAMTFGLADGTGIKVGDGRAGGRRGAGVGVGCLALGAAGSRS
jgi:hypothetical protein